MVDVQRLKSIANLGDSLTNKGVKQEKMTIGMLSSLATARKYVMVKQFPFLLRLSMRKFLKSGCLLTCHSNLGRKYINIVGRTIWATGVLNIIQT